MLIRDFDSSLRLAINRIDKLASGSNQISIKCTQADIQTGINSGNGIGVGEYLIAFENKIPFKGI